MTRQNLCPNPACGANVTGWGGGSTPARMTGLTGLPVTTGARYTANGYVQVPTGAASPGLTYTISVYVRNSSGFDTGSKTVYLTFVRSVGGDDFSQTTTANMPNGVVTRVSHTGVAPANTTGVYLIIDTLNGSTGTGFDITACLTEQAGAVDTYFDGNSAGASWDGTPDNSTSTLADAGITPNGLAVPVGLGSPAVALVSGSPTGLAVPATLGTPTAALGLTAAPGGLALAVTLGVPTVSLNRSAAPNGLAIPISLPQPTARPGVLHATTGRPDLTAGTTRPGLVAYDIRG